MKLVSGWLRQRPPRVLRVWCSAALTALSSTRTLWAGQQIRVHSISWGDMGGVAGSWPRPHAAEDLSLAAEDAKGRAAMAASEVDVEGLQDAPAAEWAVALEDWVLHEDLGAVLA